MSIELFNSDLSRYKMVIYLLNKDKHVYYSIVSEDKKGEDKSIGAMVRRLLEGKYRKKYNTALVYDNSTGDLIQKYVKGVREL